MYEWIRTKYAKCEKPFIFWVKALIGCFQLEARGYHFYIHTYNLDMCMQIGDDLNEPTRPFTLLLVS